VATLGLGFGLGLGVVPLVVGAALLSETGNDERSFPFAAARLTFTASVLSFLPAFK
jgi:hypothetical protein